MTGTWVVGKLRTGAAGSCCAALLLFACGTSGGADASTDDAPAEGSGGSSPGNGPLIQGLHAAIGDSAVALQGADTTAFWPEPATDEIDAWRVDILGAYDGMLDDDAATGHYLVTQPTEASVDFELEAAISAAPYRAIVGPSWLTIFLRQSGASGFRVDVTCSEVEVNAGGSGEALVLVGQDTGDTTNGSLFCVAAAGESPLPFSQPTTSFEVEADEDGYAVMEYFEVTVLGGTFDEGDTASVQAKVHLEFTALP
jgi:hypothetical protein